MKVGFIGLARTPDARHRGRFKCSGQLGSLLTFTSL